MDTKVTVDPMIWTIIPAGRHSRISSSTASVSAELELPFRSATWSLTQRAGSPPAVVTSVATAKRTPTLGVCSAPYSMADSVARLTSNLENRHASDARAFRPDPLARLDRLCLRGADRAMRLAWTLSDLAGKTSPGPEEMMQGISMRTRLA